MFSEKLNKKKKFKSKIIEIRHLCKAISEKDELQKEPEKSGELNKKKRERE